MVARPAKPFRSANAGELSDDVRGRVDIKQYYSAGLKYHNIEPVPQSGWRQMGGTRRAGLWRRPLVAAAIGSPAGAPGPHAGGGPVVVFTGTLAGPVAMVRVVGLGISAGSATWSVEVETAPGVWTALSGAGFTVAAGATETRDAAFAPGGQRNATAVRVRATFSETASVAIASVHAFFESGTAVAPRMCELLADDGTSVMALFSPGHADFFTEDGYAGHAGLPALTELMLPDIDFYAEGKTIGVWHGSLQSVRLFMVSGAHDWRADLWPYEPPPNADLGGNYPRVGDVWDIVLRWTDNPLLALNVTVDRETTGTIYVTNAGGTPVAVEDGSADWSLFAANLQAAIIGLSGVPAGVLVSAGAPTGNSNIVAVEFAGAAAGREYQFSAAVSNTSEASALSQHRVIGKTLYEPLWSADRGWPGHASLVQDRMAHARIAAQRGAVALSRTGEYFDFDVDATTADAARLDRLRSQTAETVLMLKESTYLLALTDRAVYLVTNRVMERGQPLNFVVTSEIGAQPNCAPFDLDGQVFYVGIHPKGLDFAHLGGRQLYSMVYNDVSTKFDAAGESLLAAHLVDMLVRTARQKPETDLDASRGWLLRTDGRLVVAQIIKNQQITGYCQWRAASGGAVREMRVDGRNRLWLAVERGDVRTVEIYDQGLFLHDVVTRGATDLAGVLDGLDSHEGAEVWALAQGYVLGPFTVTDGSIDLRDAYAGPILVGRWQPPVFESMPEVLVRGNDEVLIRPGRIHTAHINVVGTTSIAVGANGTPPADVPLLDTADPVDQPMPARTRQVTVAGLDGWTEYPTLTITQTRPGPLRVRDYAIEAKL